MSTLASGAADAAALITAMDQDRRLASEVLRKLPQMVTSDDDVAFEIEPTVLVPSLKKMGRQWSESGGTVINERLDNTERTSINLISEIARLSQVLGQGRLNPSWSPLDLTDTTDADTANPLFRAAIDYGLRFPAVAKSERNPVYKNSSNGAVIGDWLLPNHSAKVIERTLGNAAAGVPMGKILTNYKTIFKRQITELQTYSVYHPPYTKNYGGYYKWQRYYSSVDGNTKTDLSNKVYVPSYSVNYGGYSTSHSVSVNKFIVPKTLSMDGSYAFVGQTFYSNKAQVLLGMTLQVSNYSTYVAAAAPKFLLVRTEAGKPVLDDVIATGTAVATGVTSSSSSGYQEIKVTWNKPVHLPANEQLAIVIGFKDRFQLLTEADADRTGGLFVCQDHYYWSELDKTASYDLRYNLIVAEFANTEVMVDLQSLELSGGISSAKLDLVTQNEAVDNDNVAFEVEHNGIWYGLEILDSNIDLPPFVNARMRLKGSTDVMPLVHKTDTTITLIRPDSTMRFLSKRRTKQNNTVKMVYELAGFNAELHTENLKLLANGQLIEPTVSIASASEGSVVRTVRCEFSLPISVTEYQIQFAASTLNASVMFDVTSIIELL